MDVFVTVFLKMLSMAFIMVFGLILKKKKLVGDTAGAVIGQISNYFFGYKDMAYKYCSSDCNAADFLCCM